MAPRLKFGATIRPGVRANSICRPLKFALLIAYYRREDILPSFCVACTRSTRITA